MNKEEIKQLTKAFHERLFTPADIIGVEEPEKGCDEEQEKRDAELKIKMEQFFNRTARALAAFSSMSIPPNADVGELVEKANRYVKSVNAFEDGSSGDAYNELETAWYDFCAELDKWR